jgi:hypothetical protein
VLFFAPCGVYNHATKKAALTESKRPNRVAQSLFWPHPSRLLDGGLSQRAFSSCVCVRVCTKDR